MRFFLLTSLSRLADARSTDVLLHVLQDKSWSGQAKRDAAQGLVKLNEKRAIPMLLNLRSTHTHSDQDAWIIDAITKHDR
jgi:hypothetical protein